MVFWSALFTQAALMFVMVFYTSPDTTPARALAVASLACAAVVFTSAVREFRPRHN